MSQVWEKQVDHPEQAILLALADHADDDGSSVYPSVEYIAWKTGYSARQVRRIQNGLREQGVLVVVQASPGRTVEHRLNLTVLPQKAAFNPGQIVTPDKLSPLTNQALTPDIAMSPTPDIAVSPDPSVTIEPSGGRSPRRQRSSKAETPVPEIFLVTESMREWAATKARGVDVDYETEKFLDKARAKGWTALDWLATWRNWMRNAKTFADRDAQRFAVQPEHPNAHRPGKMVL